MIHDVQGGVLVNMRVRPHKWLTRLREVDLLVREHMSSMGTVMMMSGKKEEKGAGQDSGHWTLDDWNNVTISAPFPRGRGLGVGGPLNTTAAWF